MNNFIDVCKLLGNYNDKDVYLYMSSKYKSNSIFYSPNYYLLPKWVKDPDQLTLMQAVKIINFRMKHKNSDNINVKILMDMCKDAPASLRRLKGTLARPLGQATPARRMKLKILMAIIGMMRKLY